MNRSQSVGFLAKAGSLLLLLALPGSMFAVTSNPSIYIQNSNGVNSGVISDPSGIVTLGPLMLGAWQINSATGLAFPDIGSLTVADLDFAGSVTSRITQSQLASQGTLTMLFSATGYTGPLNGASFGPSGTTRGSVTVKTYVSANNQLFGGSPYNPGNGVTITSLNSGPFVGTNATPTGWSDNLILTNAPALTPYQPYALTLAIFIKRTVASPGGNRPTGIVDSFNLNLTETPEPGFYGLLSLGLSGLFFVSYRRRSNANTESVEAAKTTEI